VKVLGFIIMDAEAEDRCGYTHSRGRTRAVASSTATKRPPRAPRGPVVSTTARLIAVSQLSAVVADVVRPGWDT